MNRSLPAALLTLRRAARALVVMLPFDADADGFADATHFDGPRYYCLFRVPALSPEWQEAGEAETPDDALENLAAALMMAKLRLARLDAEFLPSLSPARQNFSQKNPVPVPADAEALLTAYRRADTGAQLLYARLRAYGGGPEAADAARRVRFGILYRQALS